MHLAQRPSVSVALRTADVQAEPCASRTAAVLQSVLAVDAYDSTPWHGMRESAGSLGAGLFFACSGARTVAGLRTLAQAGQASALKKNVQIISGSFQIMDSEKNRLAHCSGLRMSQRGSV